MLGQTPLWVPATLQGAKPELCFFFFFFESHGRTEVTKHTQDMWDLGSLTRDPWKQGGLTSGLRGKSQEAFVFCWMQIANGPLSEEGKTELFFSALPVPSRSGLWDSGCSQGPRPLPGSTKGLVQAWGWNCLDQSLISHCQYLFLCLSIPIGTSLVIQWLRLCAPNGRGLGSIPGQGTRSHMLQLRPSAAK